MSKRQGRKYSDTDYAIAGATLRPRFVVVGVVCVVCIVCVICVVECFGGNTRLLVQQF